MAYVDGFVLPVPLAKLDAYREMAKLGGQVWMEHGALEYHECIAEDVKPGEHTSFPQAVKLEPGETVVFSWVVYASRQKRDEVMAKVMQDPRLKPWMDPQRMPFDGKRMFWGGFESFVDL